MTVNWLELGRAMGWLGGILYLVDYVERKLVTSNWYARWMTARFERGLGSQGPRPLGLHPDYRPPKIHTLPCRLCGKNTTSPFGCEHPDAPEFDVSGVAPVAVVDQDPPS